MVGNGQDSPLRSSEAGLADATGLPVISIPVANPSLRVDELALARLVDQGFEEGHEALGRLRAALELLERREHECATGHSNDAEGSEGSEGTMGTMGATGPGDIYSMMLAIEQQTCRVERRLETLSSEALRIVSSALVKVEGGMVDDRDVVGGLQPEKTPRDGGR
jgi:hypothetical protein